MGFVRRAAVPFLLLGCAFAGACGSPTAFGPVIGVRPAPALGVGSGVTGQGAFDAITAQLAAQLDSANSITATKLEESLAAGQLPANLNNLSVKQSERLAALQQLGSSQIASRLSKISAARAIVAANINLTNGQRSRVYGILDGAAASLNAVKNRLYSVDTIPDMVRSDITYLAGLRVEGLVLPQVHMLTAAYDLQVLTVTYQAERDSFNATIANRQASGKGVQNAPTLVADLSQQVAVMNQAAASALNILNGLRVADYPGNKGSIQAARQGLVTGRTAAGIAGNDAVAIRGALFPFATPPSPSTSCSASGCLAPASGASSQK